MKADLGQTLSLSCFIGAEPSIAAFFPSEKGVESIFLWDHGKAKPIPSAGKLPATHRLRQLYKDSLPRLLLSFIAKHCSAFDV